MNNLLKIMPVLLFAAVLYASCSKSDSNYSSGPDHGMGMTGTARMWSGTESGNAPADTVLIAGGPTTHCPHHYSRTITDTSFALLRIDDFDINALNLLYRYDLTDSVQGIVVFDTTLGIAQKSIITYYYLHDSVTYEFHRIDSFYSPSGPYYQVDEFLHTVHP